MFLYHIDLEKLNSFPTYIDFTVIGDLANKSEKNTI